MIIGKKKFNYSSCYPLNSLNKHWQEVLMTAKHLMKAERMVCVSGVGTTLNTHDGVGHMWNLANGIQPGDQPQRDPCRCVCMCVFFQPVIPAQSWIIYDIPHKITSLESQINTPGTEGDRRTKRKKRKRRREQEADHPPVCVCVSFDMCLLPPLYLLTSAGFW